MNLEQYMKNMSARGKQDFADSLGNSYHYLRHVAKGRKTPSAKLAVAIERESRGAVKREELLPEIFN